MIDASWLLFVAASLVLIATPGQDMILVMSRSVARAPRPCSYCRWRSIGLVGHTILATLGLGAILRTPSGCSCAEARWRGLPDLSWHRLLRTRQSGLPIGGQAARTLTGFFVDGAVSNLSKPKIAIFYLTFLLNSSSPSAQYPTLTVFVSWARIC